MKPLSRLVLLLASFILLTACPIWAQQADTISQLKEQILKREAIDRDSSTPDDLKSLNRSILAERRIQLHDLLVKRIGALRKYQASLQGSLADKENAVVGNEIRQLEADVQELERGEHTSSTSETLAKNDTPINEIASTQPAAIRITDTSSIKVSASLTASDTRTSVYYSTPNPGTIQITNPSTDPYTVTDEKTVKIYVKVTDAAHDITELLIEVRDSGNVPVDSKRVKVDYNKTIQKTDVKIVKGNNMVTVIPLDKDGHAVAGSTVANTTRTVTCNGDDCSKESPALTASAAPAPATSEDKTVDKFSSIYTRGIVGFEQVGASAAGSETKPFLELFFNPPIWTRHVPDAQENKGKVRTSSSQWETPRLQSGPYMGEIVELSEKDEAVIYPIASLWGSVRLTSTPRQIATPLATFATSFLNPINETQINDLVQSFDYLVGAEFGLYGKGRHIGTIDLPTPDAETVQRHSGYFIFGFGAINPLSPRNTLQIFARPTNPDDLKRIVGNQTLPDTIKYIAFVSPDRQNFFRQYYAGFRVKTHFFRKLGTAQDGKEVLKVVNRPGAMFDITVGQNEAVTGGRFIGSVLRLDGFYPITINDKSMFYIFGTSMINLKRRPVINDPLLLETAPSTVTVPNANVFVVTSPQSNRDYYRLGFGVNLVELFKGKSTDEKKPDTTK